MMNGRLICKLAICILALAPTLGASAQECDKPTQLDSAKITADRPVRRGNGTLYLPKQIKGTVTTLGEPDIIRYISGLAGVSTGMEGTLGLFVRGANTGGNRVELNGVPLSSYSHMLGLISSISPEAVSETMFSPGGISADHGDVSSSLIEMHTKRATQVQPFTSLSVSPYLVSVAHSGRSKDCRSGLLVSGRASAMPYLIGKGLGLVNTPSDVSIAGVDGFLYDLTVQGDYVIKGRSRLDVMAYASQDRYVITTDLNRFRLEWWSASLKAGWEYDISPEATLYTKLYHIHTNSSQDQDYLNSDGEENTSLCMSNIQQETDLSSRLHYRLSPDLGLDCGVELTRKRFAPAQSIVSTYLENSVEGVTYPSTILAGFVSLSYSIPDRMETTLGLRESASCVSGVWRSALDVRLKSDVYVARGFGFELTADKFTQFHHVLEGLPVGWALDIAIPSFDKYPEESTYQGYLGAFFNRKLAKGNVDACLGGFYRRMDNLVSYKSTANFFRITDATWDQEVAVGSGRSYGAEFSASYTSRRVNATLAYTLSRTTRHFDEINDGEDFLFRYDRPHILNLNGDVLLGSRTNRKGKTISHKLSSTLAYSSGNLVTLPLSSYQGELLPFWNRKISGLYLSTLAQRLARTRYEYTTVNNVRMEDYLRLDIGYSIEKQKGTRVSSWTFSVFNVLNRHNPMLIYNNGNEYKSVSLLPIMPSVRWSCSL